ncbi:MAG: DHA2 family efflux MFS transporter permease subunit [Actinomycetales bacterium]|nr:DHA2 family efflux MFS transporter permease subunit [Actinomycetales bacterium]
MSSPQPQAMPVLTGRGKWTPMPFVALGLALIIVDSTIVNVAIPSIIRDLGITTTDAEWVNSIYALVFASLLLVTGRAGDVFGRRRVFIIGVFVFMLASVLAGLAPNGEALIGARLLQGIGGAMVLPNSLSTVNALYRGRDRAVAFGIWGATIGGTAALGPLIGGWLTEYYSWRWAFLVNIPLGLIVVWGMTRFVPETRDTHARRGLDAPGTLLSTLGLAALVFALIEGQNYGWWQPTRAFTVAGEPWPLTTISPSAVAFIVSVVALVGFVLVERLRLRQDRITLLDLRLFRIRSFALGNIAALIINMGEFGLLFTLPLFLQSVRGYSPLGTGVILLALALGAFIAGPLAGQIAARIGPKPVVLAGLALEVIGIAGIGFTVSPSVAGAAIAPWLFVYGIGVGFATAQVTNVILADVPVAESGQGSAVQSTFRQIGAALGTAVLGAVLVTTLRGESADGFRAAGVADPTALAVTVTAQPSQAIPTLTSQPDGQALLAVVGQAFADATTFVSWTAAAFVLCGLIAASFLPRGRVSQHQPVDPQ